MEKSVRSLAATVLVVLTVAASLTAQNRPSAPLTGEEIQRLIIRGEPADHARLSAHFGALADQYAADAKRHATMQPAFAGNTKLAHMAASQAAHCRQLTRRNEESAALLRELAGHHSKQAGGVTSDPPRGSERFQGTGAVRVPPDAELTKLAETAETAADHRTLEAYFTSIAVRYESEAKDSAAYARSWRTLTKNPSAPALATRWDNLAKLQRDSAAEARAAAATHNKHASAMKK
jgi:hypothetical protein